MNQIESNSSLETGSALTEPEEGGIPLPCLCCPFSPLKTSRVLPGPSPLCSEQPQDIDPDAGPRHPLRPGCRPGGEEKGVYPVSTRRADVARGDDSPDGAGSRCRSPSREVSQPSPEPDAPDKQSPARSPGCLLARDSASCPPMLSCDWTGQ